MGRIKDVDKKKKEKKTEEDKKLNKKDEAKRELYAALKEQEFIIKLRQALIINTDYNQVKLRKPHEADPQGQPSALNRTDGLHHQNTLVNHFNKEIPYRD